MAKVVSNRYVRIGDVFNMEVFGLHNFITKAGTVLHNCRYFCISRTISAEAQAAESAVEEEDETGVQDYEGYMTGGEAGAGYI